jgi:hypothetical protein
MNPLCTNFEPPFCVGIYVAIGGYLQVRDLMIEKYSIK